MGENGREGVSVVVVEERGVGGGGGGKGKRGAELMGVGDGRVGIRGMERVTESW